MSAPRQRASVSGVTLTLGVANLMVDLVPVRSSSEKSPRFSMLCPDCEEPVGLDQFYQCKENDKHTGYKVSDCVRRGREVDGKLIEVTQEEIVTAKTGDVPVAPGEKPVFEIAVFPASELEAATVPADLCYRVRPDKKVSRKLLALYSLFCELASDQTKALVGEIVLKETSYFARLSMFNGQLFMQTLIWPDDVAPVDEIEDVAASAKERKLAKDLANALLGEFDPAEYRNKARERTQALLDAKAKDPKATVTPAKTKVKDAGDLSDLLGTMLEQAKQSAA